MSSNFKSEDGYKLLSANAVENDSTVAGDTVADALDTLSGGGGGGAIGPTMSTNQNGSDLGPLGGLGIALHASAGLRVGASGAALTAAPVIVAGLDASFDGTIAAAQVSLELLAPAALGSTLAVDSVVEAVVGNVRQLTITISGTLPTGAVGTSVSYGIFITNPTSGGTSYAGNVVLALNA